MESKVKVIVEDFYRIKEGCTIVIDFVDARSYCNFIWYMLNIPEFKDFKLFIPNIDTSEMINFTQKQESFYYFYKDKIIYNSMIEISFANVPEKYRKKDSSYVLNHISFLKNLKNEVEKSQVYFKHVGDNSSLYLWFAVADEKNTPYNILK